MKRLTGSSPRLFKVCTQFVVTVGIALACASTLSAQDRLFALLPQKLGTEGQGHLLEIDTRPDFVGQVRRDIPVSTLEFAPKLYSIGSGRYLTWLSNDGQVVNLFDTVTNHVSTFPVLPAGSQILAVDSGRTRIFADASGETFILDGQLGTVRNVHRTPPALFSSTLGAHASSIERLFVSRRSEGSSQFAIDIVDVAAGRLERTLTLAADSIFGIAVDSDGRRLFVAAYDALEVYDAQSGALLMELPGFRGMSNFGKNPIEIDESRNRLLLSMDGPPGIPRVGLGAHVAAFNLDTLTLLGVASDPTPPNWSDDLQLLAGPRSPLYVFNPFIVAEDKCPTARLDVLDPNTGALRQRVDTLRLWAGPTGLGVCRAYLALQSPPAAPTIQSQTVSGRRVTLSWTPTDDAVHYDVEAGSGPGLTDLAVSPGHTSTSFTIDGIPPGRYFVRVRAINWVGRSLPSNEVELVVP